MIISLEKQIAAQRRELALRKNVYAKRVREGKMTPEEAATEYLNALAILKTLDAIAKALANPDCAHIEMSHIEAGWYFDASLHQKQLYEC